MTEADVDRRIARALRMLEKERYTRYACAVVADALDPPEPELKPCWSCGGSAITSKWARGMMATCDNSDCAVRNIWMPLETWNRREVTHGT